MCFKTASCVGFTFRPASSTSRSQCQGHSSREMTSGQSQQAVGAKTFLCHQCQSKTQESLTQNIPMTTSIGSNTNYFSRVLGLNLLEFSGWCEQAFRLYVTRHGAVPLPWWMVDFRDPRDFRSLVVTVQNHNCYDNLRAMSIQIYTDSPLTVTSAQPTLCYDPRGPTAPSVTDQLQCPQGVIRGQYVRVTNTTRYDLTACGLTLVIVASKI
ncbi:hypothetical protein ACOMHN_026709 [Nucella lapillus]